MKEETVRGMYQNILRHREKYPTCMVTKLTTSGGNKTRFWDMKRTRVESPDDFYEINFKCKSSYKGIVHYGRIY